MQTCCICKLLYSVIVSVLLGIDDVALVLQQNRLLWYGHVLRKDDDDWVKKCMEYEVDGPRPRGLGKRLTKTVKHVN